MSNQSLREATQPYVGNLLGVVRTAITQAQRIIAGDGDKADIAQDRRDLIDTLRVIEHAVTSEGKAQPVAREGWKLVPVDPTADMLYEIQENCHILPPRGRRIWAQLLEAAPQAPARDGWLEAAVAWEVCASVHEKWAKGKDALYTTRHNDFVRHAEDARARHAATPHSPAEQSVAFQYRAEQVAKDMKPIYEAFNAEDEKVCKCSLRTRLVGDGCSVCNPELAKELADQGAELSDYPPLPEPTVLKMIRNRFDNPMPIKGFTEEQMRAYVDADRAHRPSGAELNDELLQRLEAKK